MSISSAPASTASRVSARRTARLARPDGNAVETAATLTPVPASASTATGTRSLYTHTAAADGTRVIVRPSGTEPKVKCYLEVVLAVTPDASHDDLTAARAAARARLDRVKADMQRALGL